MECGENNWAPHRGRLCRFLGATALNPLFIFSARGTSLEGGNRGVQKCDSVDSLSLVIKCLGGGARVRGLDSPDVRQTALFPWRPSQHTHTLPLRPQHSIVRAILVPGTWIAVTSNGYDSIHPWDQLLTSAQIMILHHFIAICITSFWPPLLPAGETDFNKT